MFHIVGLPQGVIQMLPVRPGIDVARHGANAAGLWTHAMKIDRGRIVARGCWKKFEEFFGSGETNNDWDTLWWTNILPWKITMLLMGKSIISGHVPLLC